MAICLNCYPYRGRADLLAGHILASVLRFHLGFQENWELFHNLQPSSESTLHCVVLPAAQGI